MSRLTGLLALLLAAPLTAGDAQWAVVIHGENFQMAAGASATAEIIDGQFLPESFAGKQVFVRTQPHYELDGFRPASSATSTSDTASSAAAVAGASGAEQRDMSPFGPLPDAGLVRIQDGDFRGWYCRGLVVTPLGGRDYRLSCNESMQFQ